ncbi:MAG: T9SS type A sorting domain-containing protein [Ignavibacteriaceae bacterium]|nr:T9SS type A sorting domain-containing protein [Ignavibacteriaceae bacterium]
MRKVLRKIFFIGFIMLSNSTNSQQINIPVIEQMPNLPLPYEMRNWKAVTVGYDEFVFDLNKTGEYLPLAWLNNATINYPENPTFGLHTVVGTPYPQSAEAINCIPAVIGASLSGIDKSNQNGFDWVKMCQEWFNKRPEMNVYKNHWQSDQFDDWWYITMPNLFFYQLNYLYPNKGDFETQFRIIADRFLESVKIMGGSAVPWKVPNMNYRGWDFTKMQPYESGVVEPEAAGAIGWILYNAFVQTGELKYRMGAEWCLEFLNNLSSNPSYEIQLPYGVYTAARMNAELNTKYDVYKFINWCFEQSPLRNWGVITGKWGLYDVNGLVGELSPRKYAFLMNTFEHVGALVPLVRYDTRFARAIGKWVLNAANSIRLFYSKYLPDLNQDSDEWSKLYDPNSYIGHEALLQLQSGSPYATGDAISGGWGATNLSLYSSSHVGILGGIIDTTNVQRILKLDVLKTDYYHGAAYPTFLYFNPYQEVKELEVNLNDNVYDLYDAVTHTFLKSNCTGKTNFIIQPNSAVLLVLVPSGGTIEYNDKKTSVNGTIIDYNNGNVIQNNPPRIKGLGALNDTLVPGSNTQIFCTAEDENSDSLKYFWFTSAGTISGSGSIVNWAAPINVGNFLIKVSVVDPSGLKDSLTLSLLVANMPNRAPKIINIKADPRKITLNSQSKIVCIAEDVDGDNLIFNWMCNDGSIAGQGSEIIWNSPPVAGNYYVTCVVSDEKDGKDSSGISLEVRDLSIIQTGNLVAFYPFNGNAVDASGNENNGTINGCSFTFDRFGINNSALLFNGLTNNVRISNSDNLNFTNSISINFWIKPTEFYQREAFPISHGSWENRWKVSIVNQKIRWTVKTDNASNNGIKDLDSEMSLIKDSLYNVTVTYTGSEMEIFINAELDAFINWSGKLRTTSYDLMIGQRLPFDQNYNYKGILDDVRIYDYGLSLNEIYDLFDINTSIDNNHEQTPNEFKLSNNYPNPFNSNTIIEFYLPHNTHVLLKVFDVLGRELETLVDSEKSAGSYETVFIADKYVSGVYFYKIYADNFVHTRKMILIR